MRKIFLAYLFLFLSIFSYSLLRASQEPKMVVAFDLHGVVLHYDWTSLIPRLWAFSNKWQLIKNLPYLPVCALVKTLWNKPSFEQVLQLCGNNNPALKDLLIDLSVQQRLAHDVAFLIQRLVECGHAVHVLSNIGAESYQRLCRRYAGTFNYFSAVVTSDLRDECDCLIKKPDPRFFDYYLRTQNLAPVQVVFIDDRSKNIEVAKQLGMQTILFKNAEQLQNELELRNLISD